MRGPAALTVAPGVCESRCDLTRCEHTEEKGEHLVVGQLGDPLGLLAEQTLVEEGSIAVRARGEQHRVLL